MNRFAKLLVAALVAVLALSNAGVQAAAADAAGDEGSFVALLNQFRQSNGVRPLAPDAALTTVARAWSAGMAAAGSISHNPALASQAPSGWSRLGENVGMGMDVQGLHDAFVNSPTHYRNMVDGGFDSVGVGVVRDHDAKIFVTVTFMATKVVAAATPVPAVAAPAPPPPPPAPTSARTRPEPEPRPAPAAAAPPEATAPSPAGDAAPAATEATPVAAEPSPPAETPVPPPTAAPEPPPAADPTTVAGGVAPRSAGGQPARSPALGFAGAGVAVLLAMALLRGVASRRAAVRRTVLATP